MTLPLPGQSVRGSQSGRPIMAALDLFGRRGSLRLLWELRGEPLTFRALQAAADSNPAQLNTRLKELRHAQLVLHEAGGYRLSPLGVELLTVLGPLHAWSERWAACVTMAPPDTAD
jgi:DNA-binding HxlR family transcriptional regulator